MRSLHPWHALADPIVMSIAIRIMGLLLVAVAVQFMLNVLEAFRLESIALVTSCSK